MSYFTKGILIISLFFIFSSCSDKQYQVLFQQKTAAADSLSKKNTTDLTNYRIQPQDILQVRNLQSLKYLVDEQPANPVAGSGGTSTLQGQSFQVEEDGIVALPVIGRMPVAGLTRMEATKLIENAYRAKLLNDPIIEVTITNLKVTILGEVKAQGNYPLVKDKTTLIDIIGSAGGLTDKANEKNIKIIHGTDKNAKVTQIDLNSTDAVYDPNALLHNGDIVYVAQNRRAARNDNLQNLSLIFQPALIVFNTLLIIFSFSRR